jgi:hypothetical protein
MSRRRRWQDAFIRRPRVNVSADFNSIEERPAPTQPSPFIFDHYIPETGENVNIVPGLAPVHQTRARRLSTTITSNPEIEEDSENYKITEVSSSSLEDEYITNSTDENCEGDWMKRNCMSCQSPITLEAFENTTDVISFKLYNEATKKIGKGQCMAKNEVKDMLSNGESNIFSIWKGGDNSGRGGKPTKRIVVKLYTGGLTIFITLQSAYKIFHSEERVFYAISLYGGKRRRVGNLYGRIGVSENHGQVPGFQIYRLYTRSEIEEEAKIKEDFSLDFLVTGKMEELISMFMDTTIVREFLLKKIVEYIVGK